MLKMSLLVSLQILLGSGLSLLDSSISQAEDVPLSFFCLSDPSRAPQAAMLTMKNCGNAKEVIDVQKDNSVMCIQSVLCSPDTEDVRKAILEGTGKSYQDQSPEELGLIIKRWGVYATLQCKGKMLLDSKNRPIKDPVFHEFEFDCPPPDKCNEDVYYSFVQGHQKQPETQFFLKPDNTPVPQKAGANGKQ